LVVESIQAKINTAATTKKTPPSKLLLSAGGVLVDSRVMDLSGFNFPYPKANRATIRNKATNERKLPTYGNLRM
jgi:hypothetical protein